MNINQVYVNCEMIMPITSVTIKKNNNHLITWLNG